MFNLDQCSRELYLEHVLTQALCPGHSNQDHDQKVILEFDASQGGGRGHAEMKLQTKSINERYCMSFVCLSQF